MFATPETKTTFDQSYDRYGDHYTDDVSVETLKQIFADISKNNKDIEKVELGPSGIMDIERRYFDGDNKRSLFRRCRFVSSVGYILYNGI